MSYKDLWVVISEMLRNQGQQNHVNERFLNTPENIEKALKK